MKFTDSPVIELTVNGTQLSIQQDNATMHVGTSVWPCSLVLAKFAERWSTVEDSSPSSPNPYAELLDFRGRRAVELGTGCGVAGMAFHLLGLTEIVLTDMVQVMPALKHNLKRNKAALGKYLKTSIVCWNNRDQISALNPPFDLVIAADVVYIEESVGHLVTAMESFLRSRRFLMSISILNTRMRKLTCTSSERRRRVNQNETCFVSVKTFTKFGCNFSFLPSVSSDGYSPTTTNVLLEVIHSEEVYFGIRVIT